VFRDNYNEHRSLGPAYGIIFATINANLNQLVTVESETGRIP